MMREKCVNDWRGAKRSGLPDGTPGKHDPGACGGGTPTKTHIKTSFSKGIPLTPREEKKYNRMFERMEEL